MSINGSMEHRLPGNLNICFHNVDAETLMAAIRDVAVSSGSACNSEKIDPSHVLTALGLSDEDCRQLDSLRHRPV